jgi:hypothetical protein
VSAQSLSGDKLYPMVIPHREWLGNGTALTPEGGPRERCPFSGHDLSGEPHQECQTEQVAPTWEACALRDRWLTEAPRLPLRGDLRERCPVKARPFGVDYPSQQMGYVCD